MNAMQTVVSVLTAHAPLTALVADRISPLIKSQYLEAPAITLQRISSVPVNSLQGACNLDGTEIQVDAWSTRYAEAVAIAAAARAALEAAGHTLEGEIDNHDPSIDEGLYSIVQRYYVWLPPG